MWLYVVCIIIFGMWLYVVCIIIFSLE
jgi:hypothetical protein